MVESAAVCWALPHLQVRWRGRVIDKGRREELEGKAGTQSTWEPEEAVFTRREWSELHAE